ncbi:uncharacterized protein LOC119082475 [Bradysia coprophila]|uniref:uncharacterized protein LOC119067249 n=1 Tax=Bradysia coprophila TaxID=38358 RepID=UPI00187DCBF7|nr:uncharacterized protein LOC119067249 [Bradysia coprophila]XP_037047890.1 uncharacterized protein LOC119082475 [Bradysia coprophila]
MRSIVELIGITDKIIPTFPGEKYTEADLHKFLKGCEIALEIGRPEEQGNILECIKRKLTGEAYLEVKYEKCVTYGQIKKLLISKYKKPYSFKDCQKDLWNCKQAQNESLECFLLKVQTLYRLGCEAVESEYQNQLEIEFYDKMLEKEAVYAMKMGLLRTDITEHMVLHCRPAPDNIKDTMKLALEYEKDFAEIIPNGVNEKERAEAAPNTVNWKNMGHTQDYLEELSRLRHDLKSMLAEIYSLRNGNKLNVVKEGSCESETTRETMKIAKECYICNEKGHVARTCPRRLLCRRCGGEKHNFRGCKRKITDDQKL